MLVPSSIVTASLTLAVGMALMPDSYLSCIRSLSSQLVEGCYLLHGAVFGAVRAAGAPPALLRCNAAFGRCQATRVSVWIAGANVPTALVQLEQQMRGMSLGPRADEEQSLDSLQDGFVKMNIKRRRCLSILEMRLVKATKWEETEA